MRRKVLLASGLFCLVWLAVVPAEAIVGGHADGNLHPEVGAVVGFIPQAGTDVAYCSGSLISPTVFLTAAHCAFAARPVARVTFDEHYTATSTLHSGVIHVHPGWNRQANTSVNDVAVIVLDQAVTGITPAQLPTAGLLDELRLTPQSNFTTVGYGDTEFVNGPGGKTTTHVQARHYAVGSFRSLAAGALHLSQNAATGDGGSCNGDSGGPNYIGAGTAETDTIAAITNTGDTYCNATGVAQRLDISSVRGFLDDYVVVP
ncbi:MAG: trypsin-like serine protease [Actinomycetota bacterium]|nr:trypsin-like serine protease [Actinomycetota bacterium]